MTQKINWLFERELTLSVGAFTVGTMTALKVFNLINTANTAEKKTINGKTALRSANDIPKLCAGHKMKQVVVIKNNKKLKIVSKERTKYKVKLIFLKVRLFYSMQ
ncbi:hypothetical protein I533_13260 [Alteromonas mediterranea MED64]|nr:hypothetical protein I533_13260 [Alteromonas mediterranea MED64]